METATASTDTILVIEDEPHMRTLLHVTLKQEGYRSIPAANGTEGIAAAIEHSPSVVLLDLGLPDIDGVDVAAKIRAHTDAPIIVISARTQEEQKIQALDGGASDYVTKPFGTGELLARIRVALRQRKQSDPEEPVGTVQVGDLEVDFDMRTVKVAGKEIHLTPTEYKLLGLLMRSEGRVLTHRQLLQGVWGPSSIAHVQYLRVYMKRLRYKLEPEPARPRYLINEPGVGYRLRFLN
jgi:two-component system KDP operon response regulator KdpE